MKTELICYLSDALVALGVFDHADYGEWQAHACVASLHFISGRKSSKLNIKVIFSVHHLFHVFNVHCSLCCVDHQW